MKRSAGATVVAVMATATRAAGGFATTIRHAGPSPHRRSRTAGGIDSVSENTFLAISFAEELRPQIRRSSYAAPRLGIAARRHRPVVWAGGRRVRVAATGRSGNASRSRM